MSKIKVKRADEELVRQWAEYFRDSALTFSCLPYVTMLASGAHIADPIEEFAERVEELPSPEDKWRAVECIFRFALSMKNTVPHVLPGPPGCQVLDVAVKASSEKHERRFEVRYKTACGGKVVEGGFVLVIGFINVGLPGDVDEETGHFMQNVVGIYIMPAVVVPGGGEEEEEEEEEVGEDGI